MDSGEKTKAELDSLAAAGQQRKAASTGNPEDLEQAKEMQSAADREKRKSTERE